jgi:hypothetical protein
MCGPLYPKKAKRALVKEGRFHEICSDVRLFQEFEAFLIREYAQENLWFYRDVLQFENTQFPNVDEMKKAARQICDKYLGTGQDDPLVYADIYQLQEIERALKTTPNNNMFKNVKFEVESILKTKYIYFCEQ